MVATESVKFSDNNAYKYAKNFTNKKAKGFEKTFEKSFKGAKIKPEILFDEGKILKKTPRKILPIALALSGAATVVGGKAVTTLFDKDKGSMTNRVECAKEHLKNDANLVAKLGLTGGLGYVISKNPKIFKPVVTTLGKGLMSIPKAILKLLKSPKATSLAEKLAKLNPTKVGIGGLVVAGGVYVAKALYKNILNKGKIEQKYDDAAKIESQTKNIVLDDKVDDIYSED